MNTTPTSEKGMDEIDRQIINRNQAGFPLESRPFAAMGASLGLSEAETLGRIRRLVSEGYISRLGPVLHPRRLGGQSTLAALAVPAERLDEVIAKVNAHRQISQNYIRTHTYNLWFVVTGAGQVELSTALAEIEAETGLPVLNLPMLEEYYVGVNFQI
jgi:siroheme decarboxylase